MPFSFDFGGFDPSAFGGFSGGDASQPQRPKRERKPRKAIGNCLHADAHQSGRDACCSAWGTFTSSCPP